MTNKMNLFILLIAAFIFMPLASAQAGWFSPDTDSSSEFSNAYMQRYGSNAFEHLQPAQTPAMQKSNLATDQPQLPATSSPTSAPRATNVVSAMPVATNTTFTPLAPQYQTAPAPMAYRQPSDSTLQTTTPASTDKRAEIDISTLYDNDPSSDVNGGSSYGIETTLYSNTIDHKWRLFAGELFMHELEPFGESNVNYSRSTAGIEYNYADIQATLAPTFNDYNGNQRTGAAGDLTWYASNNWAFGGGAQLFSRDISLRALASGVTANSYDANATWFQDTIRTTRFDVEAMNYSDGNFRTTLTGSDIEHLYKNSHIAIDGLASVVESQNSDDENRAYFNPSQDVLGMAGLKATEPLYKTPALAYDHSLEVKPGVYWQKYYGTSPAVTATYAQHVNFRDNVDAAASINFTRQDADGEPNNDLAFLLNLSKKF